MANLRVHLVIVVAVAIAIGSPGGCVLPTIACAAPDDSQPVAIALGDSVVALNGPWRFHTGDDLHWAEPLFDDSRWESVDLTPPPGAHDSDVGLTGYVPGWGARGHAGHGGYGWYRIRVAVTAPATADLALAGPPAVDSAYQVYLNGQLLGGIGDFTQAQPRIYSIQPRKYLLPEQLTRAGTLVIAFRVWMGPWGARNPVAGGIHIAPSLGELAGIEARYRSQWLETFKGYIVEVVEAFLFILLAGIASSLALFDGADRAYRWLATALVLTAMYRANQALYFWTQCETTGEYELLIRVLIIPLAMGAYMRAWYAWFRLETPSWPRRVVPMLTMTYIIAEFLCRSWFYGLFPSGIDIALHYLTICVRLLFMILLALITYHGIRRQRPAGWYALPAVLSIAVALFAQELTAVHVPGIWFPFGTGVSRTQYAYAVFDVALAGALLQRLRSYARRSCAPAPGGVVETR
jgi:hypothetical protein